MEIGESFFLHAELRGTEGPVVRLSECTPFCVGSGPVEALYCRCYLHKDEE